MRYRLLPAAAFILLACTDDELPTPNRDSGASDAATSADAGADTTTSDASVDRTIDAAADGAGAGDGAIDGATSASLTDASAAGDTGSAQAPDAVSAVRRTVDDYRSWGERRTAGPGCHASGRQDGETTGVIKGGSYLCARSYCVRFRATARHPQDRDVPTSHLGFRTVFRGE